VATFARVEAASRPASRDPTPPPWLAGAGALVALLGVLPVAYLLIVAVGSDDGAVTLLLRERTLGVLMRTVALAAAVT
jgi:ABC-type Fe3+ transport system permease subunit